MAPSFHRGFAASSKDSQVMAEVLCYLGSVAAAAEDTSDHSAFGQVAWDRDENLLEVVVVVEADLDDAPVGVEDLGAVRIVDLLLQVHLQLSPSSATHRYLVHLIFANGLSELLVPFLSVKIRINLLIGSS